VDPPHYYYPSTRTFYDGADITHLSPRTCEYLWHYAVATAKQAKCPTVTTQVRSFAPSTSARRSEVSVKVKGKWVTKTKHVRVPKKVTEQVTESVPGPPAPCYANGALASSAPSDYANYVFALQVLTHESIHLYDFRSGGTIDQPFEIRAECQGMQWLTRVATSLGTTADDAQAIANYYYYTVIYPTRKALANGPYPYWSADCHQDGPLDLSPGDGVWP
jgi:hypothetical protein